MPAAHDPTHLPPGLPVPADDGACLHLRHAALPPLSLPSTAGAPVNLADLSRAILFFYPRTGVPGQPPTPGFQGEQWDSIPGARGCTPHSCGFRDLHEEFRSLGVEVYGVSTNSTDHQREFRARMHIPFHFLSDSTLALTRALRLPTFEFPVEPWMPTTLIKRMAWFVAPDWAGVPRIIRTWYPVFPPDKNASEIAAWLTHRSAITVYKAGPDDAAFLSETFEREWKGEHIWSRGVRYSLTELSALIAREGGDPVGLLTYVIMPGGYQAEVVTLNALRPSRGIGAALLDEAAHAARAAGCHRIFLTTTNDNMHAIEFYQRQGWRLAAIHRGSVDQARLWSPNIPHTAKNGIPIRDELELELAL